MKYVRTIALALILPFVYGCPQDDDRHEAHQAVQAYRAGDYGVAEEKLQKVSQQTNEDFVLNNCRLGSTELVSGKLDESEAAFLRAYEVINSVGVNQGGRRWACGGR